MYQRFREAFRPLLGTLARRRRTYLLLALPNAVLLMVNLVFLFRPEMMDRLLVAEARESLSSETSPPPPPPKLSVVSGRFLPGASLDALLKQNGFAPSQSHELFSASRRAYDLSKVRAGNRYTMEISSENGELRRFEYDIDDNRYLTLERDQDGWKPAVRSFPFEKRAEAVSGVITDNLFNAIVDAGEKDILALQMSEIFQWDVDFYTDLRVGDGFRLLVEKQYLQGQFVKYGSVLAAELSNQGKIYKGFLYLPAGHRPEYYSAEGRPLRRKLRKSPLQFTAPVSSRFSKSRFHPFLKIYRPHLGIDYRAPEGTPVVAIADGRIAMIGKDPGGGGNTIRLDHRGGMSSMYLHLSRFASALAKGTQVQQGEVIGYVGKTGLATGPHLDFRILRGNRYLNPAKVHGTPVDPLPAAQMPAFLKVRDEMAGRLAEVPLPVVALARK